MMPQRLSSRSDLPGRTATTTHSASSAGSGQAATRLTRSSSSPQTGTIKLISGFTLQNRNAKQGWRQSFSGRTSIGRNTFRMGGRSLLCTIAHRFISFIHWPTSITSPVSMINPNSFKVSISVEHQSLASSARPARELFSRPIDRDMNSPVRATSWRLMPVSKPSPRNK